MPTTPGRRSTSTSLATTQDRSERVHEPTNTESAVACICHPTGKLSTAGGSPDRDMNHDELQRAIDDIAFYIRRDVASGFEDPDRIVPRDEQSWPAVTDCDRFDAAFADLERAGVACRHNFSCCGNCAAYEIRGEIEAERAKGREIIGCAHYNCQDTESAVERCGFTVAVPSCVKTFARC